MAEINGKIIWPDGPADIVSFTPAAAVTLTVSNMLTYFNASAAMAAAMTLNFQNDGQIRAGARAVVRAASDATARTITPGTNALGTAEAGVISKTKVLEFEYNGTAWVLLNARQID